MFALLSFLLLLSLLSIVEGIDVNVLPVSQAVGVGHLFTIHTRTVMTAFIALIARHYGVATSRIALFFGGQHIQNVRRVRDIPGFHDGYTVLLVVRNQTATAVRLSGGLRLQPHQAAVDQGTVDAARRAHDVNWGRIANRLIGNDPNVDPAFPDHHERNYILTVAVILTESVPGIVNINGLAGGENFNANVIYAIMYYYRQRGWPTLNEAFVQAVYEQM